MRWQNFNIQIFFSGGHNSTQNRRRQRISSYRCCVGNHPRTEGRGTAVPLLSPLGQGPGRTQKGGFSWLHGVREPAEKVYQLEGGLRGWALGPTQRCPHAHVWSLVLPVGRDFSVPTCGFLTSPVLPHPMATSGLSVHSLLRLSKASVSGPRGSWAASPGPASEATRCHSCHMLSVPGSHKPHTIHPWESQACSGLCQHREEF